MSKPKIFADTETKVICCVEGMHTHKCSAPGASILFGPIWPDYWWGEVTPCDKTCEGKPTLEELNFSDETVQQFRSRL